MKKYLLTIACALCLICCACSAGTAGGQTAESATAESANAVAKEPVQSIDQVSLTDKDSLYTGDPLGVRTFYLTVREGNAAENTDHSWAEINSHSVYEYEKLGIARYQAEAILQEGDANGPLEGDLGYGLTTPNATVQIRGQTSSRYAQKNYKIELKKGIDSLDGQRTIALNKHWADPLRIRNKLCYDLMAQVPSMMSLRTQFVHLYVKDETEGGSGAFVDYGLYTWVEQLNKTALMNHGADRNGQLYKVNFCEFYRYENVIKLKTDPTYDKTEFEKYLEIKGSDDHTKLIAMLDAVNDYSTPIEDVCDTYFDMDNMLTWMAFHILTGNVDTQSRNMYLYSPLNGNKWYFWSWDNDASFDLLGEELRNGTPVDRGWEKGISNYWGNVLFRRVLKDDTYREMLDKKIQTLYAGVLAPDHVQELADQYAAVAKPYVYTMPDQEYASLTSDQYDVVLANMAGEVKKNYQDYEDSLSNPMPFYVGTPESAADGYVCQWDAAFDFNDPDITYTAQVSDSLDFSNILAQYTGTNLEITMPKLEAGQYFIKVTATDSAGKSQTAFDYYVTTDSVKIFGVKCFYVLADGSVQEPSYEE
jgi:spore coat protein H